MGFRQTPPKTPPKSDIQRDSKTKEKPEKPCGIKLLGK